MPALALLAVVLLVLSLTVPTIAVAGHLAPRRVQCPQGAGHLVRIGAEVAAAEHDQHAVVVSGPEAVSSSSVRLRTPSRRVSRTRTPNRAHGRCVPPVSLRTSDAVGAGGQAGAGQDIAGGEQRAAAPPPPPPAPVRPRRGRRRPGPARGPAPPAPPSRRRGGTTAPPQPARPEAGPYDRRGWPVGHAGSRLDEENVHA